MNSHEIPHPLPDNRYWRYRGETIDELLQGQPTLAAMAPPQDEEIIAKIEAACICSSDIKVMRMGRDHPLFIAETMDTVLGHEMCLRVMAVGQAQRGRFYPGQRLALQPALAVGNSRSTVGMDRPGAFAQYIRLDSAFLTGNVMEVPDDVPAAIIALLEPYACVERAWTGNVRRQLKSGGRALIVVHEGADFTFSDLPGWREIVLVGECPAFLDGQTMIHLNHLNEVDGIFDDILALGDLPASQLGVLCRLLAKGGMLLQGRRNPTRDPVLLDPARIHYDELAFVGTKHQDLTTAFAPDAQRFDVRSGGVALIHGAGGAMGRIHVHRLLQLPNGPKTIIASSRKGQRLDDLAADFAALAREQNRQFLVTSVQDLAACVAKHAPNGLDDAVIVAPDPQAIADVTGWLAPDGLLAVFAGFPYGKQIEFDLAAIALWGKRLTGSSGCTIGDMKGVLDRFQTGELDISANIAAIAGLDALPLALKAVADGTFSGKVMIYPHKMDLPLTPVKNWQGADEAGLIG